MVENGTASGSDRIAATAGRAATVERAAPPGSGSWGRAEDAVGRGFLAEAAFLFSARSGFSTFGVRVETAFFDLFGSEVVEDGSGGDEGSEDGAGAAGAGSGAGFGRCANPG